MFYGLYMTAGEVAGISYAVGTVVVWLICAICCSIIARKKGRSAVGWFFCGFFFGLIGLIIVCCLSSIKPNVAPAADEILKFKQLLDAGVITQEEFEQKKKELLG